MTTWNQGQTQRQQPAQTSSNACEQIRERLRDGHGSRRVWITRDGRVLCYDPTDRTLGDWLWQPAGRVSDYSKPH